MNGKTYPEDTVDNICNDGETWSPGHCGLTKREYFAALALQGFCVNDPNKGRMYCDYESIAELAVKRADELIEALNKG